MTDLAVRLAAVLAAGALWFAGLRLFLRSELSGRRKIGWTAFLLLVGIGAGFALPLTRYLLDAVRVAPFVDRAI